MSGNDYASALPVMTTAQATYLMLDNQTLWTTAIECHAGFDAADSPPCHRRAASRSACTAIAATPSISTCSIRQTDQSKVRDALESNAATNGPPRTQKFRSAFRNSRSNSSSAAEAREGDVEVVPSGSRQPPASRSKSKDSRCSISPAADRNQARLRSRLSSSHASRSGRRCGANRRPPAQPLLRPPSAQITAPNLPQASRAKPQ